MGQLSGPTLDSDGQVFLELAPDLLAHIWPEAWLPASPSPFLHHLRAQPRLSRGPEMCPSAAAQGLNLVLVCARCTPGPLPARGVRGRSPLSAFALTAHHACLQVRLSATWSPGTPSTLVRESPRMRHSKQALEGQPSGFKASFPPA